MIGSTVAPQHLLDCLLSIEPVDLQGVRLLRAYPADGLFPTDIPREQLREATIEITQYIERCRYTAQRLHYLAPIPLTTRACLEYGL